MFRLLFLAFTLAVGGGPGLPASGGTPASQDAAASVVRFAVIGDMGNGSRRQRETAQQMWQQRAASRMSSSSRSGTTWRRPVAP